MAALSGKELDDSIFGTDTHLDWADEVTMTEVLHGDTLGSGSTIDYSTKKPKPEQRSSSRADSSRGFRSQQQGSGRQSRQGVRPSRSNNDMNVAYGPRTEFRKPRGGQRGGRGRGRGGWTNNSGHYQGGNTYANQQANTYANQQANTYANQHANTYANQQAAQQNGIPISNRRGSRDRSLSNERMGSMERSRGWGRPGSYGRQQRADMADRWEHDRFEGNRSRARSGSSSERWETSESGVPPVIGKEGIAHVIIHRRGSSGSARGPPEVITSGLPPQRQQTFRRGSLGAEQAPVEPPSDPAVEPLTPTIKEADNEAEEEWENFVANGGLDMPLERITDDLCRQRAREHQKPQQRETTADVLEPAVQTKRSSSRAPPRVPALDDEDDDDDDDDDDEEEDGDDDEKLQPTSPAHIAGQGISIRGTAKKASPPASYTVSGEGKMATLVIDQVASPRVRRPSIPIPEKAARYASPPSSAGIRIKGTSNGTVRVAPTQPTKPTQPVRPSPPASPRSRSRSSSTERTRTPQASVSTYVKRQFEGYDEDRGRHQFSINISYEDGRYAPIHVHERDDVAKLAAKYARTWRVHGKELRIKTTLSKMRAAVLESQLL